MKRGVLYIVWGDKVETALNRSIESVKRFHPDLPIHVVRGNADEGLKQKSRMGSITPFESALYLDSDTVVMSSLDFAFERAEQFGLACCINECPWARRYGSEFGDWIEYNTGVLFFTPAARQVFATWESIAPTTLSRSVWLSPEREQRGSLWDDQASFARAIAETKWNPYVLPFVWNLRPEWYPVVFAPAKIWHDYSAPPESLELLTRATADVTSCVQVIYIVPASASENEKLLQALRLSQKRL
jgi:hypothetical protein